uniref:ARAD1D10846p n=1 Tax=Blastobotrys adeninivorans TaxID=409370 RepID=A0A060T8F2_BLAAD
MQIFLATHPRAASTAFERSFMTRTDLTCAHEPFGEAFYQGPERLSDRYSNEMIKPEYEKLTYYQVFSDLNEQASNKPLFIKDMAQYLIPPQGKGTIAPSMQKTANPTDHDGLNPTVIPSSVLDSYRFVFLIRAPHLAVPSYYRCCIPPQSEKTGFDHFRPSEAGYRELRMLYDYLKSIDPTGKGPLVVESSDLTVDPEQVMSKVCESVGIEFDKSMLSWGNDNEVAEKFSKWPGFHDDVLGSTGFRTKPGAKPSGEFTIAYDQWEKDWAQKFDSAGVKIIKQTVEQNLDDYLYLREHRFRLD